jgi:GrpB-like predicted nucleotidyltransferase (UPF0157 family)
MPTLVEIVPYDPKWTDDFSRAEALLRNVLGVCVVAVEHIGSTAVPGLPAKPILDVDVIVPVDVGEETTRLNVEIAESHMIGLKRKALDQGMTLKELLADMIERELE